MADKAPRQVFAFYHRLASVSDDTSSAISQQADRIAALAESHGLHPSIGIDIPEETASTGPAGSGELPSQHSGLHGGFPLLRPGDMDDNDPPVPF